MTTAVVATSGLRRSFGNQVAVAGVDPQLQPGAVLGMDSRREQARLMEQVCFSADTAVLPRWVTVQQLLNDYFDAECTIVISTHQVEEVENILTHALFMNRGRATLCDSMPALEEEYVELRAVGQAVARAESIPHVGQRPLLGGWLLNALWVLLAAAVWLRRYRWEI